MARELVIVTDGVWVATSRNYATTSTIVARGGNALLIDPAWEPDELTGLAEALAEEAESEGVSLNMLIVNRLSRSASR